MIIIIITTIIIKNAFTIIPIPVLYLSDSQVVQMSPSQLPHSAVGQLLAARQRPEPQTLGESPVRTMEDRGVFPGFFQWKWMGLWLVEE